MAIEKREQLNTKSSTIPLLERSNTIWIPYECWIITEGLKETRKYWDAVLKIPLSSPLLRGYALNKVIIFFTSKCVTLLQCYQKKQCIVVKQKTVKLLKVVKLISDENPF